MFHGEKRRNQLHATGRADQMADHGFDGTNGNFISARTKNFFDDQSFVLSFRDVEVPCALM